MTDATPPVSIDTLLAERPWVEALARRLVHDDATARDVVQQTWLAAIEHPPSQSGAVRGWLSRVVRNAAAMSHRSAGRRARHEALAVSVPAADSPADTVARAEAHQHVVAAVMSLDEPYRSAVLLRFFEGIESDEVAARTGVPVETARTRIKRALAQLRERLDGEHGGDGRAWAVALLPLLGARRGMLTGAGALSTGGVMMASVKSVAASALAGALVAVLVTREVMKTDDAPGVVVADTPQAKGDAPEVRTADAARAAVEPAQTPAEPLSPAKSALAAAFDEVDIEPPVFVAGTITGRVLTKDGAGVAGVTVKATSRSAGRAASRAPQQAASTPGEDAVRNAVVWKKWNDATMREAATDPSGAYSIERLVDGMYSVSATAKGWQVRLAPGVRSYEVGPGGTLEPRGQIDSFVHSGA